MFLALAILRSAGGCAVCGVVTRIRYEDADQPGFGVCADCYAARWGVRPAVGVA